MDRRVPLRGPVGGFDRQGRRPRASCRSCRTHAGCHRPIARSHHRCGLPNRPGDPVWPAACPQRSPNRPPCQPGCRADDHGHQVPQVDATGPGCGWAFTNTTAPAVDAAEIDKRGDTLRAAARKNLLARQQAWRPAMVSYYAQWSDYLKSVAEVPAVPNVRGPGRQGLAEDRLGSRRVLPGVGRLAVGSGRPRRLLCPTGPVAQGLPGSAGGMLATDPNPIPIPPHLHAPPDLLTQIRPTHQIRPSPRTRRTPRTRPTLPHPRRPQPRRPRRHRHRLRLRLRRQVLRRAVPAVGHPAAPPALLTSPILRFGRSLAGSLPAVRAGLPPERPSILDEAAPTYRSSRHRRPTRDRPEYRN